ncbi:MAG: hypothetical protein AMS16_04440 [Planctomycetes bacterium DG_58]|nr:MAG: hypothetical protein AMS16_04440 [Planctomycetes bacterium DG_58]KPL03370.1 MAG: hypothetical protein AMK75_01500 [Planctomycetes bacterium SM23_65]
MSRLKRIALLLGIFAVVFSAHLISPVVNMADSRWVIHTAMSIVAEGNTDLNEYEQLLAEQNYYHIEEISGRRYAAYPIGPSLMVVPFVAARDVYFRVVHGYRLQKHISQGIPFKFEKFIASVLVALTAVLMYLIAGRRLKSVPQRLVIVFVFAFCTSAWSTASRALWQHGPSMLMLSATLYLILLAEDRPKFVPFAGLPLAFSYVVRPTNIVPIVVLSLLILLRHRRYFLRFVICATVVWVPFVVFNFVVYGKPLSWYYMPGRIGRHAQFLEALAGNLVSPARGLFLFSPVLILCVLGLIFRSKEKRMGALDVSLLVILLLHWLVISSFPHWWAGHSFGPRFFCDMIPFFMWFLIPVVERFRRPVHGRLIALVSTFVCLTAVSFFVHFRGANHSSTYWWNAKPNNIDRHPERLWDWSDVQFLR